MTSERLDLVGLAEVALLLGVRAGTVRQWRVRGKLPPPITELMCGPIWHRKAIEEWAANEAAKLSA